MPAPNNRTLTILPEERGVLRADLLSADDVAKGKWMDATILSDMRQVLPLLPEGFADLVILDPPYNLSKRFGNTSFRAVTIEKYAAYLEQWIPLVVRSLAPYGSLYLCGDWRSASVLQTELTKHLTILNRITWQREKGRGSGRNWKNCLEDIWFAVRDPKYYTFNANAVKLRRRVRAPYRTDGQPRDWQQQLDGIKTRLTSPSNLWDDITVPFWSMSENTEHPTQKSEKLLARLILASSNEGDVVFDPFLGSGTTSVVAKKLGRHFVGIEQDETYALLAAKRLQLAESDKRIQGYKNGEFYERNSNIG